MTAEGDCSMESERAVAAFESWGCWIFLASLGPFLLSDLFRDLIDDGLACYGLSIVFDLW